MKSLINFLMIVSSSFGLFAQSPINQDCACIDSKTTNSQLYQSLDQFTTYKKIVNVSGWNLIGKDRDFNSFAVKNYMYDGGSKAWSNRFSVISSIPVKIINADNSLMINLNPCVNASKRYEVQMGISFEQRQGAGSIYDAIIDIKNVGIELNSIVSIDSNQPSYIFGDVKGLAFDSNKGLSAAITNICLTQSKIAGTSVLIDLNEGKIIGDRRQHDEFLDYTDFFLFQKSKVAASNNISTQLTNFAGLFISKALLEVPYKDGFLKGASSGLLINNKFIAGQIEIPNQDATSSTADELFFQVGDKKHSVKIPDFEKHLLGLGFSEVKVQGSQLVTYIYFKKLL